MKTRNREGFSLVEMMIAVSLVGIVIGMSTSGFVALARSSSIAKQCSDMHADLRIVVEVMSKDLMSASEVLAYGESAGVLGGGGGVSYVRVMAQRGTNAVPVYYIYSANRVYKFETSAKILAEDVTGMNIVMYEDDGLTVTTTPADAFSIDITLTMQKSVGDMDFDDTFQSRVMLRNKQE